ncbi:hypothetical protein V2J09_015877 [Rumex salicifolius]
MVRSSSCNIYRITTRKKEKMGAIKNRSVKKKAKTRQSIEGPFFTTVSNTDNEATDDETLEEILQGKRKKEEKNKEQEKERRKNKIEVSKKKKQEEKKEKEKKTRKKGGKKEENDQKKLSKEGTNTSMRSLRQQYKTLVCRTSPNMIVKYFASGKKEFSVVQRQTIIDLGFEALLE